MNPILPIQHFVPDGEARLMPDGRLYLYGSYDISGAGEWCSHVQHAFSTNNLVDWIDHGVCLNGEDIAWANSDTLFAPDCIHKNGKYYMYFCMLYGYEGVAVADTPYGPFTNPSPIEVANMDSIDPSIFVDDDGQAYYFWGQFYLNGAKMNPDMKSLDLSTLNRNVIDEKQHGFHEGSCMRKRNGLYYLVFTDTSRGKATCLGYAVSKSPLGPFEKRGIIVDNIFCDPETWNNHGSIEEFKGQWYVFYHRSSQGTKWNRRMCLEPITFDENGDIKEVSMTTQGCEPALDLRKPISAGRACTVRNGFYITPLEDCSCEILENGRHFSTATFRYVKFENQSSVTITVASLDQESTLEIWADGEMIGDGKVTPTGGWKEWGKITFFIKPVSGIKTLYLSVAGEDGKRLVDVREIQFNC